MPIAHAKNKQAMLVLRPQVNDVIVCTLRGASMHLADNSEGQQRHRRYIRIGKDIKAFDSLGHDRSSHGH